MCGNEKNVEEVQWHEELNGKSVEEMWDVNIFKSSKD